MDAIIAILSQLLTPVTSNNLNFPWIVIKVLNLFYIFNVKIDQTQGI